MRCRANDPHRFRRRERFISPGFTLIELLLVVAILAVLATVSVSFMSPDRQQRTGKACQERLQKTYLAMEIFANDHSGSFPGGVGAQTSEDALDVLVPKYTVDTSIFTCPDSKDAPLPGGESIRKGKISYAYYAGRRQNEPEAPLMSDRQINDRSKSAGEIVFSSTGQPPGNNHRKSGGNVLFTDGRVEFSPPSTPFSLTFDKSIVLLNPKP